MPRAFPLILSLFLGACSFTKRSADDAASITTRDHKLVFECRIVDDEGQTIRNFGEEMCLFHPDGRVFGATTRTLVAYDNQHFRLWSLKLEAHHQLNWSVGRKQLLALGNEPVPGKKGVRGDVLYVVNLDGTVAKRFSFTQNAEQMRRWRQPQVKNPVRQPGSPYKIEFTHANSFYEIPPNGLAAKHPAFAAGNYIVNAIGDRGTFILDAKLEKILWVFEQRPAQVHDVQVLANGNLLAYVNEDGAASPKYSSLREYNPLDGRVVWEYKAANPADFHSPSMGGVQVLENGNVLFSEVKAGQSYAVLITREGRELWRRHFPLWLKGDKEPRAFQQIKREDLGDFLRNNVGL